MVQEQLREKQKKTEPELGYGRDYVLLTSFYQSFSSLRELTKSAGVYESELPSNIEARRLMAVEEAENLIYLLGKREVADALMHNGMTEFEMYGLKGALENLALDLVRSAEEPKGFFQRIEKALFDFNWSKMAPSNKRDFMLPDLDTMLKKAIGPSLKPYLEYRKFVLSEQEKFKNTVERFNDYLAKHLEAVIAPLFNFSMSYKKGTLEQGLYGILRSPSFRTYSTYRKLDGQRIDPTYASIKSTEVVQSFLTPMVVDYVVEKYLEGDKMSIKGACRWLAADIVVMLTPLVITKLGGRASKEAVKETIKLFTESVKRTRKLLAGRLDDVMKQVRKELVNTAKYSPEKLEEVLKGIRKEFEKGIKELAESAETLSKGALDLYYGKISGEALAYRTFTRTSESLRSLGFSEDASRIMAFSVASSEAKMYTLPGHAVRTSDLVDFMKEMLGIPADGLFTLHDIGKVAYPGRVLRGKRGWFGSQIHKLDAKNPGMEIIKTAIMKGHTYWEEGFIESLERMGVMSPEDLKLYEKLKLNLASVFDHHEYGAFLGMAPPKVKVMEMFADSLDAVFSLRTYKGGVPTKKELLESATNFTMPRKEIRQNAYMDALDESGLSIGNVMGMLAKYNEKKHAAKLSELFGTNYRIEPKINEKAVQNAAEEMGKKFSALSGADTYFKNLAAAYVEAKGWDRTILEYAIGAMLE